MAKPNYSYEKRQRELAKKKKKEDKAREKAERKSGGGAAEGSDGAEGEAPADDAEVTPQPAQPGSN
ncbi:MAG: hypothetical protein KA766_19075 [Piscinibacter sp.]|uniref:hypothetical protein n=1 Tax=Piscinibacter sp. TaxID=1903157 RepID=UPI001B637B44|nr:hypothetical protein [Piscinibacter sp.]MBP5992112.1 hypothetical protein [Piscinibacter sp.]MBP6029694.1 hypothetical protein [Piscinibacter sp.]